MRLWLPLLVLLASQAAWADDALWALLKKGGQYVLIRHGLTDPGVGDPPGFSLADCKTQRNLNAAGRKEAQAVGAAFRGRGIPVARVLSSPWCRCQETARLAFGGYRSDGTLSNLFTHPENRERQLAAFRRMVRTPPQNGNAILVTHGATVSAFTGVSPGTAELVIVTPGPNGGTVAGRMVLTGHTPPPE